MYKSSISLLLLAFFAQMALADKYALLNDESQGKELSVPDGQRRCFCLTHTRTTLIRTFQGSNARLFSRSDCTGNFQEIGDTTGRYRVDNAEWVNSMSVGDVGIPSWGPDGYCPNWYIVNMEA